MEFQTASRQVRGKPTFKQVVIRIIVTGRFGDREAAVVCQALICGSISDHAKCQCGN